MAAGLSVQVGLSSQTLLYTPRSGTARSIEAIVEYPGPESMDGIRGGSRPHVELLVRNHATLGILARDIDTGGAKVTVPMRRGRAARTLRITQIISHDKAMLRLRAW